MILTDLMELDGKNVKVVLNNGEIYKGVIHYIPSYSEMYGWRRAHYFYLIDKFDGREYYFRAHHVFRATEINLD